MVALFEALNERVLMATSDLPCIFLPSKPTVINIVRGALGIILHLKPLASRNNKGTLAKDFEGQTIYTRVVLLANPALVLVFYDPHLNRHEIISNFSASEIHGRMTISLIGSFEMSANLCL